MKLGLSYKTAAVWAEIAVVRLVDVAEGDEPEATTAPGPSTAS